MTLVARETSGPGSATDRCDEGRGPKPVTEPLPEDPAPENPNDNPPETPQDPNTANNSNEERRAKKRKWMATARKNGQSPPLVSPPHEQMSRSEPRGLAESTQFMNQIQNPLQPPPPMGLEQPKLPVPKQLDGVDPDFGFTLVNSQRLLSALRAMPSLQKAIQNSPHWRGYGDHTFVMRAYSFEGLLRVYMGIGGGLEEVERQDLKAAVSTAMGIPVSIRPSYEVEFIIPRGYTGPGPDFFDIIAGSLRSN